MRDPHDGAPPDAVEEVAGHLLSGGRVEMRCRLVEHEHG
jgi:hypothetical protein